MDSIPKQIIDKLILCGLTRPEAAGIHNQMKIWLAKSGMEWTVQHLKLIKQTILSIKGDYPNGISPYVKTRNHRLVGPFRAVQRLLERGDKRSLQALMIYTNFISAELTAQQKKKFVMAVRSSQPDYWYEFRDDTIAVLSMFAKDCHVENLDKSYDETYHWSDSKFAPSLKGSVIESDKVSQLRHFVNSEVYRIIYYANGQLLPEDSAWFQDYVLKSYWPKPKGKGPIGKISVLQEPGFKARFIANPNRIVQHALKPLGDFLFSLIRKLPWDCTFDQSKAQTKIKKHLSLGRRAYCYDLSNATDQFPLRTQIELIYSVLSHGRRNNLEIELCCAQLRLFSEVARSTWSFGNEMLSWTRGQPLGLYPSFAMFSFCHGAILLNLCNDLGIHFQTTEDWVPPFYIVGDDVVILDENLAISYRKTMEDLGVAISESKSIASEILAEFAGEVIIRDRVYKPVKWRNVTTKSFSDFIKVWGYEAIPLLPRHLRDVAYAYAEAPEPVGLGLNPKGKTIGERMDHLLDLYLDTFVPPLERIEDEEKSFRSLQSFLQDMHEVPYQFHKVNLIPKFGRTGHTKCSLLKELVFERFLTNKDIHEYFKFLIQEGRLDVEEIHQSGDVKISASSLTPESSGIFIKFKNMLSSN